jgi:hypothetical protein
LESHFFALNQSNCEDDVELEEAKTRTAKKLGSRQVFTPSKHVKFEGYADDAANEYVVPMEVPTAIKLLLKPAVSRSNGLYFVLLTEDVWGAVCS